MKRFLCLLLTCVTMHLLIYVVKATNLYYLYLPSILKPELKDTGNTVLNSSKLRSNG